MLFERAIDGLPFVGVLGSDLVVERTAGWSGAEIVTAVEEAMSRSLLDRTDALTNEHLLVIIGERYVISDPTHQNRLDPVPAARHEAAHAIYAHGRLGAGSVGTMSLRGEHPTTALSEDRSDAIVTAGEFRILAGVSLAGLAFEILTRGAAGVTSGSGEDRIRATERLIRARDAMSPIESDIFERGQSSDRGSERMRAARQAAVEDDAARLLAEVIAELAPLRPAIESLADAQLSTDELTLSGAALTSAIEVALSVLPVPPAQSTPTSG